jgi:metallo-beta-lactamase family protein
MTDGKSSTPVLTFHGAAGTVTGSCFLLAAGGARILVDCGMFQGSKTLKALNWRALPFDPRAIDAVVLTHAHTDHAALIPRLTRLGFTGPVHATDATVELCGFMLPDSGGIQEVEARQHNRRYVPRGKDPVDPIYTRADAEACLAQFVAHDYDQWIDLPGGMRGKFWNAGHLLGSASVELQHAGFGTALFSGDIGPGRKSFITDAESPSGVDWLVMETTYGDRDRDDLSPEQRRLLLATEVQAALDQGGNLLIPAFAVERTQELLHDLDLLMERRKLPTVPIVIDSPLATQATSVFRKHLEDIPPDERSRTPLAGANIRFTESVDDSKALNRVAGGMIILSASGMAEAGRIRHHLINTLHRPQATVLFVGYQAPGTLGRLLVDGADSVRIMGQDVVVRARIRTIEAYSGHADRRALLAWLKARLPVRRGLFLVHGEPEARDAFAAQAASMLPAEKIIRPELDAAYALAEAAQPLGATINPAPAKAAWDWHNERTALLKELDSTVAALGSDAAREKLLYRLRQAVKA